MFMQPSEIISKISVIEEFLIPFYDLFNYEPLHIYPHTYSQEVERLIALISSLKDSHKCDFINYSEIDSYPSELKKLLEQVNQLIKLPQVPNFQLINNQKFKNLTNKKAHEISAITSFLSTEKISTPEYLDFAGGKGHLSFHTSRAFNKPSTCIDFDEKLIEAGESLFSKNPQVNFIHADINKISTQVIKSEHHVHSLHCCGDLTDLTLKYFVESSQAKTFLGFGCCYHKIKENFYLGENLLSNEAKTLAMKSYRPHTPQELESRVQLKKYRYSFELFLRENKIITQDLVLKSSRPKIYQLPYIDYCLYQAQKVGIEITHPQLIAKHFECSRTQEKVQRMIDIGILRSIFARVIEVYITLKRIPKKSFESMDIQVAQFFDRKVSQRNIGIYLKKK